MHILTADPYQSTDMQQQAALRQMMRGLPDHLCIVKFKSAGHELAKRFLEFVLSTGEITDPDVITKINQHIDGYRKLILPITTDIGPPIIRRRTDVKLPSPQLPAPPREGDQ